MPTASTPKHRTNDRPAGQRRTAPDRGKRGAADRKAQQREAALKARRKRTIVIALAGVALLGFAVIIAIASSGESGSAVGLDDLAGSPSVVGDPLPSAPSDPATDPAVGQAVPVTTGAGFDGVPTVVGEPGTPQMMMFVASWCPACEQELPQVVDWLAAGGLPDGVEFTTVITGLDPARPNWSPDAWLDEEGYTGRVIVDDAAGTIANAYGMSATPFWVALDAEGAVAVRVAGLLETTQLDALAAQVAATG